MSRIEQLINQQISVAELGRQAGARAFESLGQHPVTQFFRPCLAISRECGSDGSTLARLASERLKWQIFDREIVEVVARSTHVRRRLIESVDERVCSGWSELRRKLVEGEGVTWETYLHHLRHVILALGHHGKVIILGRGANYILPPECAFRVRLVAPLQVRARRVALRENLPLAKAMHRVQQTDAERAAFVRRAFAKDINSAADYDLVLNTGEIEPEAATGIVLAKLQARLQVRLEPAAAFGWREQ